MAIHCAAAERGVLTNDKKEKKENKVYGYSSRLSRLTSGGLIK